MEKYRTYYSLCLFVFATYLLVHNVPFTAALPYVHWSSLLMTFGALTLWQSWHTKGAEWFAFGTLLLGLGAHFTFGGKPWWPNDIRIIVAIVIFAFAAQLLRNRQQALFPLATVILLVASVFLPIPWTTWEWTKPFMPYYRYWPVSLTIIALLLFFWKGRR